MFYNALKKPLQLWLVKINSFHKTFFNNIINFSDYSLLFNEKILNFFNLKTDFLIFFNLILFNMS